jgi:Tfp pilus assembly protein PilF
VAEVKPTPPPTPPVVEPPKPPETAPAIVPAKPPEPPDAGARPDAARPEEKKPVVEPPKPPEGQGGAPAGKSFDWYIQQAYRLRERNQAAAALALYEKAGELQPDSVEPLAGKAYCYVDLERLDEAIALFGQALARHPRFLDAIMGMAEAYKQKGDNKKAVEFYKRYVDQAPDGPEADVARNAIEKLKD